MPDSTDVQLIRWSNERTRTLADAIVALAAKIAAYKADYAASGLSTLATKAGVDNLADGYSSDGRQPVTGTKIINFQAAINALDTALNTTTVAGVGTTVVAIASGIQVNGSVR